VINFRFHVVAVTAVVGAVVIGLVVGTLAMRAPVTPPAGAPTAAADQRGSELQEQVDQLSDRISTGERLAADLAPSLLGGRLAGRQVTVVVTPTAGPDVAGVVQMLAVAGAAVAGRIELTDRFSDPARRADLLDLAVASVPAALTTGLPGTDDGVVATAALFAAVLVRRSPALPDGDVRDVLAAYVSRGFLTGASTASPADAIVFLTGTSAAAGTDAPLAELGTGLAPAGVVVAAGTGAAEGSVLGRLRQDPAAAAQLSTVDNVNTPQGKLATAWALADRLAGRVGHYGHGPGAAALLPPVTPPAPSPPPTSPASSESPSPSPDLVAAVRPDP
jgi:hypothetical protein